MKTMSKIGYFLFCVIILGFSWVTVLGQETDDKRHEDLYLKSQAYIDDLIYVKAIPLLEEAKAIEGEYNVEIEQMLKTSYEKLSDLTVYDKKFEQLLLTQVNREDAKLAEYMELIDYYKSKNKYQEQLNIMKKGASTYTELLELYEETRYLYTMKSSVYENATEFHGGYLQITIDGKWGLVNLEGQLILPCIYDKISTFSTSTVIVSKDGEIYGIDLNGNRVSVLKTEGLDFTNMMYGRFSVKTEEGYVETTNTFGMGSRVYEEFGLYSVDQLVAVKIDGKYGVMTYDGQWYIEPTYSNIISDELGNSINQNAFFVEENGAVYLVTNKEKMDVAYDNAVPFNRLGYAAVEKNGKWGYINTKGELVIEYQYDDAKSFSNHLAGVEIDGKWGYINVYNDIAIEPKFKQAKNFYGNYAVVETEKGYQIIKLNEEL